MILEEENSFLKTLDNGLKRLSLIIDETLVANKLKPTLINGAAAFELLDTFGFPIDLTTLIAAENNLNVDESEFEEKKLQKQKTRNRAASEQDVDIWITLQDGKSVFVGYDSLEEKAKVLKYRKIKSKAKSSFKLCWIRHRSTQKAADRWEMWFLAPFLL